MKWFFRVLFKHGWVTATYNIHNEHNVQRIKQVKL